MTNPLAQDLGGVVLLPCPFCGYRMTDEDGGVYQKSGFIGSQTPVWEVCCGTTMCNASVTATSREFAITAWNTRTHSAEIAGALRDAEMWQPIESAPRTGIAVLLWQTWKSGRDCTTIGHYANGWCDRFNEEMTPEPTHWRPLPAPPAQDSAMQQGGGGGE